MSRFFTARTVNGKVASAKCKLVFVSTEVASAFAPSPPHGRFQPQATMAGESAMDAYCKLKEKPGHGKSMEPGTCARRIVSAGAIVIAIVAGDAAAQAVAIASKASGKVHLLPATMETTQWGWFDNAQPPVLRIDSGDTVVFETVMHSHNAGVPGRTIEEIKKLRTDHPGRGPHTLTGPVYVNGAEPGDVLKVTLLKIVPRAYATNFNVPGMFGEFPSQYPDGQVKYLYR